MNPSPDVAEIVTLLIADIVGSTRLLSELGDAAWAEMMARHDRAAREAMERCGGREIDRADGFLVLFERPIDAVRFAFEYHAVVGALERGASGGHSGPSVRDTLTARVGIHLGEAVLRENAAADVARGAKPLEVEGLALPAGARVMSLAQGGQTLLTRAAFDLARRAAVGDDAFGPDVRWLAHGPYAFKGFDEPVEVFEVGREARAPLAPPPNSEKAHRALRPGEEELLGWRPAPGLAIERRPNWRLERKLGEGGFGEVWLARHDATHEARVFKFCFAIERLRALKRELTLFLLIKEALGERPDIQRLYDLNFDAAPYFLEMDYSEGGDLAQWAEARGGIATVPFATRLELVAQVADAAGAAHSLGIIHKDIKPSNVLVGGATNAELGLGAPSGAGILPANARGGTVRGASGRQDACPTAKLTDFGIGQLADKSILEQIKVAATGFTGDTLAHTELSSRTGTRLYMAPELLAGKLPSIQSDVYSLGVMLYQLVVGDLARPITTDWRERARRAGADALLLDDLAACLAGEPADRLASARDLATRLRTLPQRRRARRRRNLLRASAFSSVAMVALLAAALAIANRERTRADLERELRQAADVERQKAERNLEIAQSQGDGAQDVISFVLRDLKGALDEELSLDRGIQSAVANAISHAIAGRVATPVMQYYDELDIASWPKEIQMRHAFRMLDAGRQFEALGRHDEALALTTRSLVVHEALLGPDHHNVGRAWNRVGILQRQRGEIEDARRAYERTLAIFEKHLGPDDPVLATVLNNLALVAQSAEDFEGARRYHDRALAIRARTLPPDHLDIAASLMTEAGLLRESGRFEEIVPVLERALAIRESQLGPDADETTTVLNNLATTLSTLNRLEEATRLYERLLASRERTQGPEHPDTALIMVNLGVNLRAREDYDGARAMFERALVVLEKTHGPEHSLTATTVYNLGRSLESAARFDDALPWYRRALAAREKRLGAGRRETENSRRALFGVLVALARKSSVSEDAGDREGVWREALSVLEGHPNALKDSARTRAHFAEALYHVGRESEARDLVERLRSQGYPTAEIAAASRATETEALPGDVEAFDRLSRALGITGSTSDAATPPGSSDGMSSTAGTAAQ